MQNNANYSSITPDYKDSKKELTPPGVLCLEISRGALGSKHPGCLRPGPTVGVGSWAGLALSLLLTCLHFPKEIDH